MEYKRIKPRKIYEEVAEVLLESIKRGELKPGDKLDSVQQLAENFQVGRSAIREALSALRAMGLVEMKQGEGTYIKGFEVDQISSPITTAILMDKGDVVNLLEVRKIIEAGAAASAALKRTEENLHAMMVALDEMKEARGDEEIGEQADMKFHLAIAEASQNPLLTSLLNHVSELMIETMKETRRLWLFSKQTTSEKLREEHVAIYNAIKEGNEAKARSAMLTHLENVESILEKYFRNVTKEK
ncbi:FadR/GntR family transcriptional regulator [Bacillus sp. 31A1R]|uniref:FadR/GntR family transcriptional regulator n=1 Tax=Robertmurraya mangrovi TaxID=3098077 RepID=A0ABU5ITS5_9BACI|nr:FadR/GntR family transcriptional regulator [Bacillus sp. 31A1R]MDZ5470521.1 FadR/GntR family transcriptional regulator [Bacillus sp. 31A1R]